MEKMVVLRYFNSFETRISGIYNNSLSKLEFDINDYAQMTKEQKEESLKQTVRILAGQPGRNKRAIMVNVLAPTVLAPFAFAPLVQMVRFSDNLRIEINFSSTSLALPSCPRISSLQAL